MPPLFFVGMHQPSDAYRVERAMVSVNRLEHRKSGFPVGDWILDSGAFTRITRGRNHLSIKDYARNVRRWSWNGNLLAAVSQDYMCEPFVLNITGLTVADHQEMTTKRYLSLVPLVAPTYLMPVLQGFKPEEYVNHLHQYGDALMEGAWVGVGSVCKRNGTPDQVVKVLDAIQDVRPDLRLHGFGIKLTALAHPRVRDGLYSTDSMAWSYGARIAGRNGNSPEEAVAYAQRVDDLWQT